MLSIAAWLERAQDSLDFVESNLNDGMPVLGNAHAVVEVLKAGGDALAELRTQFGVGHDHAEVALEQRAMGELHALNMREPALDFIHSISPAVIGVRRMAEGGAVSIRVPGA